MRNLHALPDSPATQPYNQMKPYNSGGYVVSHYPSYMDMAPNYLPQSLGQAPTAFEPVTPPMQYAPNVWVKQNDGNPFDNGATGIEVDIFGLPMGGPVGRAALVARPNSGNPYYGDMASPSAQAEQSFPFQEAPYQQPFHGYQEPNPTHRLVPSHIHQPPSERKESIDHLKSYVDVNREQGAELRALRLLDKTTIGRDPDAEPEDDRPRRSIAQKVLRMAQKEIVKNKKAKQLRKQKVIGYYNKSTNTLAESSRTETTVRKGYDPQLIGDKCQIDFDRQRGAQLKALNLLNSNLF